jgi:hypothetical protein
VLTNEQISEYNLTVVSKNGPAARASFSLMRTATRIESAQRPDTFTRSQIGSFDIEVVSALEGSSIVVEYIGYVHFDLNIKIANVTTRPINFGSRKYFGSRIGPVNNMNADNNDIEFGLGETSLWLNSTQTNDPLGSQSGEVIYRKKYVENSVTPSVSIATTNAEFRTFLNKCKGDTFCIVSRNNRVGIYNNGTGDNLKITPLPCSDEHSDDIAGVDYLVIYNSLYRRKQSCLGLINTLSTIGDFDIVEFGIIDSRVYIIVEGEDFTARLLYHSRSDLNTEVEIPDVTKKTKKRKKQTQPEIVYVVEPEPEIEPINFTEEEEAQLSLWRNAHSEWVTSRNQPLSQSRAVWFSHYSMMLIRRGETPNELDIQIMSKV